MESEENLQLYQINDNSLAGLWKPPQKRIYSTVDIPAFQRSKAILNINGIISLICTEISLIDVPKGALNDKFVDFDHNNPSNKCQTSSTASIAQNSLKSPPKFDNETDPSRYTAITIGILKILDECIKLKNETPPFPGPRRYGNLACRDWHDKLTSNIDSIIDDAFSGILKEIEKSINYKGFRDEIKYYLLGSFGSRERLDYGTGHELSFISFLGCLVMAGLIEKSKMKGSEWLLILAKYYDLIKSLILYYTLEPAGSHGVWGLDDHFHLIYVFGACQLIDFKALETSTEFEMSESRSKVLNYRMGLTPSSILNLETLRNERCKNLYYNAISFIRTVKTGAFNEHSPILYEVSASKNWEKVARGMLKMYYGEVLSKFPVVQHFYFGGVFYPWLDKNGNELPSSDGQNELLTSFDNNENNTTTGYNEEQNTTMGTVYPSREGELSKLLKERRHVAMTGRMGMGRDISSSIPISNTIKQRNHNAKLGIGRNINNASNPSSTSMPATQAPWKR